MRYRVPGAIWLGLLVALALPAVASATLTPSVTLSPSTVAAGSTQTLAINVNFAPSLGDYPTTFTLTLPPGLIPSTNLVGGACLASATPKAGCEIGSGIATAILVAPIPVTLWLVKGPSPLDIAGAALVTGIDPGGALAATADVTLRTTPDVGINLSFPTLPSGINGVNALDLNVTGMRMPTSCPLQPEAVGVTATSSQVPAAQDAGAVLTVTGCGSLTYAPRVSGTVNRDNGNAGAEFIATVTAPAVDAATQALELDMPRSVSADPNASLTCLLGTPCVIGTASASSPLLPSGVLTGGIVNLGGTVLGPTISVGFPPPFPLGLTGSLDPNTNDITFNGIPDLPLTSLTLDIGNGSSVKLFRTTCAPGNLTGKLTPWDGGATVRATTPLSFGGSCSGRTSGGPGASSQPTISGGSLRGVVRRAPKLAFRITEGAGAPVERVAVALPKGLSFARTRGYLKRGITVRGSRGKKLNYRAAVRRGVLTIALAKPAAQADVAIGAPAAAASGSLARTLRGELRHKRVTALRFLFRIGVAGHASTPLALSLRPKS